MSPAVKGFVLAAGLGERLRPITETVPKPLLPVGNVPLIGYALKLLAHHGITDVIVNVHHLGKVLRDALGDGSAFGVQITYSVEKEILGTGGGLKKMHEALSEEAFVVLNSDTVLDLDLGAVIDAHRSCGALATMVLRQDPRQEEFGQIEIDATGRIQRILGQGASDGATDAELRSLMFAGVHIIEPRFLDYIPPDVNTCVNRYAYVKALSNGEPLYSYVMDGYWADAGTPARYFAANRDVLDQRVNLRHVDPLGGFALAPKKEVAEVVRMGENVALGADAHVVPPVLLGNDTRIGDNATVGPYCIVGEKVHIAPKAEVTSCILLSGARVEAGARVDGRIIGKKASVAIEAEGGAVTSRDGP